ncbi:mitotic spindle checkpoint protein BUBR1 isoform X2 [Aristolochia californica]|uniref:mitotic spindle checkpoint protein BUBR1 isoform X2 n=1 Tax=Aristolochia californica TaxID=171875 RepID=UPI0035DCECDE
MELQGLPAAMDPETSFLASKQQTGNEWELYKENVRPLKRGRNVSLLNEALKSQRQSILKKSLLEERRRLIEAIDDYKGDDPLKPWLECIKWVQESFPSGGECSGLVVIYEQCVRSFWHADRYKNDLRYLKIWLEYAENCSDAEVIYNFLHANDIGQTHSIYYVSYALLLESKNKTRKADDIFSLGIARKAQPAEKLGEAYKKFLMRSTKRCKITEGEPMEDQQPTRNFGTALTTTENRRHISERSDFSRRMAKVQSDRNAPIVVYNDSNPSNTARRQPEPQKSDMKSWHILGTQSERNKENTGLPAKWSSVKIPVRAGPRAPVDASPSIEVFVDEECAELQSHTVPQCAEPSILQLRRGDKKNLKKESELLKDNPLRNFPPHSLPR